MTGLVGTFGLGLGLLAAALSTLLWWRVATRNLDAGVARQATWLVPVGAVLACAALEWALLRHDFSVRYVAEHGSRHTPLYYTLTSLWSALDGSLLLWLLVLSTVAVLVARRAPARAADLHPVATAVVCSVTVFFFALALFAGHAFETVSPAPTDGPGPNPLLQDHPAMGVHPPLLYVGYVSAVVPFAYAVAALVRGRLGRRWLVAARPWAMVTWTCLTAGIVLGAWWSYAVLGWGGYWAWDPVENASILPWLVTTAFLHSAMATRRSGVLRIWNVLLATAAFVLVALGTFLTRSGVVESVHSFTQSQLGPMLLTFLAVVVVAVTGLVLWRAPEVGPARPFAGRLSREQALLLNNVILVTLTAVVLLGTLFPLVSEALSGDRSTVGAPYYDRMAVPLVLALLVLLAAGPVVRWGADGWPALGRRLRAPGVVGLVSMALAGWAPGADVATVVAIGLAAAVVTTALAEIGGGVGRARRLEAVGWASAVVRAFRWHRRAWGGQVVHIGLALAAVAVAVSSTATSAATATLHVGDQVSVQGVRARLQGVDRHRDARTMTAAARLRLDDGHTSVPAAPALRFFRDADETVSTPAIRTGLVSDWYVVVLAVAQDGSTATVRLSVHPLVGWLWAGGALMVAGALLAAVPQRRRPRPGEHADDREPAGVVRA